MALVEADIVGDAVLSAVVDGERLLDAPLLGETDELAASLDDSVAELDSDALVDGEPAGEALVDGELARDTLVDGENAGDFVEEAL